MMIEKMHDEATQLAFEIADEALTEEDWEEIKRRARAIFDWKEADET